MITDPAIGSIRVDERPYFANACALEDAIHDRIAEQPDLKNVILACPAVNAIDASALKSIEAIAHRLGSAGIGFHLSEVKGPVMDALKRLDFLDHFKGQIFLSQFEAVSVLSSTHGNTAISPAFLTERDPGVTKGSQPVQLGSAGLPSGRAGNLASRSDRGTGRRMSMVIPP